MLQMLMPEDMEALKIEKDSSPFFTYESYIDHCLELVKKILATYCCLPEVKKNEPYINLYKNIDFIEQPQNISILDQDSL
ncbi:MAG: hypothetical protein JRI32_08380, partial [Deltaproteobacteria bacterium]|nr:hypothetical protein [Deltaproteobacteria bacterium]